MSNCDEKTSFSAVSIINAKLYETENNIVIIARSWNLIYWKNRKV